MPKNRLLIRMYLDLMELNQGRATRNVLQAIGDEIGCSTARINEVVPTLESEDDYRAVSALEGVIDEECEEVEELLGIAFVAIQPPITKAVEYARRAYQAADQSPPEDYKIRRLASQRLVEKYSEIEIIFQAGNFYKHRDQWRHEWKEPGRYLVDGKNRHTIDALEAVIGKDLSSTGALRSISQELSIDSYERIYELAEFVEKWRDKLVEILRTKFLDG